MQLNCSKCYSTENKVVARGSKCQTCLQTGQGFCAAIDNMGQDADLEVCR